MLQVGIKDGITGKKLQEKKLPDYFPALANFILVFVGTVVDMLIIHISSQLLILETNINIIRNEYFNIK